MTQEQKEFTTWFHELSEEELTEAYAEDIALYECKELQEENSITELTAFHNSEKRKDASFEDIFQSIFNPLK